MPRPSASSVADPELAARWVLETMFPPPPMPVRPDAFLREVLGCEPWGAQLDLAEAISTHRRVACVGGHGTGKDWLAGRLPLWWLTLHRDQGAKAVITGPTHRQVAEIVWRETRSAYNASKRPLGGKMLPTEAKWELADDCFAIGFATDNPYNLQGFHSPHLLVIVTEAHGMSQADMDAVKRLNPERLLLTGNALSSDGEFHDAFGSLADLYHGIRITAGDAIRWQEEHGLIPGLVTAQDVAERAREWGEDSPLYRASVLAEFPESSDVTLFAMPWLQGAKARAAVDGQGWCVAGIDVAGPGEDETVLAVREGGSLLVQKAWNEPDPRGAVLAELAPWRARMRAVNVDAIGIGYNFALHIRDQGYPVQLVNVGAKAKDTERYVNRKAELYWALRQRFGRGEVAGLVDAKALSQLASMRYTHTSGGRIQIESKDDARKRGVPSPDRAEAIMLAFAEVRVAETTIRSVPLYAPDQETWRDRMHGRT